MIDPSHSGRTPFDHVAVAFAMVMSLATVRLLDGLRPALATRGGSWLHASWIVQKLTGIAMCWWVFWWLRDSVHWTAASFLWVLIAPALLFLQATALVTTDPGSVADWTLHFASMRRWFFAMEGAFVVHSIITATLLRGVPLDDPLRVIQGFALVTAAAGVATARASHHAVLALVAMATQAAGLAHCFYRP